MYYSLNSLIWGYIGDWGRDHVGDHYRGLLGWIPQEFRLSHVAPCLKDSSLYKVNYELPCYFQGGYIPQRC